MATNTRTARPDAAPAKRGMFVVGGFVMLLSVAAFFRIPVLPAIGADLGMSASRLGMITTAFALGRLATDLPAGRLADRLAPLHSLALAGCMLGLGSGVFALAPTGSWVIGSAVVLGVASAIANTVGMTYFSQAAPTARRGMSMAWFSAALLGGQSLGPTVGGLIAELTGWRGAIGVAAGLGSLVVFAALAGSRAGLVPRQRVALVPRSPATTATATAATATTAAAAAPTAATVVPPLQAWLLYAVAFVSFFMLGAMPQTLVAIIGGDRLTLGAGAIGLALGLGGVCRFVGALGGGRLADRVSRKGSLVPGLVLGAVGVALLAPDLGLAGWLAAIVLLSLGSYSISTGATMLADHSDGRGVGRRLGKYRFVGDLGLVAGPALTSLLYEHVGTAAAVLLVAGLMALVALLGAVLLTETRWLATTHPLSSTVEEQP